MAEVSEVEEGPEADGLAEGGEATASGGAIVAGSSSGQVGKALLVQKVAPPWDPLCSPDWDKESHSKEALLRIKRYWCSWCGDSCGQLFLVKGGLSV